jgi:hypothetical protein
MLGFFLMASLIDGCRVLPEPKMAIVPNELLKCVVFLGYQMADGSYRFAGTAFFVDRPVAEDLPEYAFGYLVTAKHVIEGVRRTGLNQVWLRANVKGGGVAWGATNVNDWVYHTRSACDIAAMRVRMPPEGEHLSISAPLWRDCVVPADTEPRIGEEIFIPGLFHFQANEHRNHPILRAGTIASLPGEPISTSIGSVNAYLVEVRSLRGLSGSPVFRQVSGFRSGSLVLASPNFQLLGLVHGHFDFKAPPIESQTKGRDAKSPTVNMGIGIVIPAWEITDVIANFDEIEKPIVERIRKERPTPDNAIDPRFEFLKEARGGTFISRSRIVKTDQANSASLSISGWKVEIDPPESI